MPFTISDHRLVQADFDLTPNRGGALSHGPKVIVVHDTAGSSFASSVSWLKNRDAKASAHLVVSKDGTNIAQLVPFNQVAWHAGKSSYEGRSGVNSFSIGIEFDNPGRLDHLGRAWFGSKVGGDRVQVSTPEHGDGFWSPYTEDQLNAGREIIAALGKAYPTIERVVGHWYVSPGRKFDTNPLFPMEVMQTALEGRGGEAPDSPANDAIGPHGFVTVDGLNVRRWPSNNDNIVGQFNKGDKVLIDRSGWYEDGFPRAQWHYARRLEPPLEGWVHSFFVNERF